MQTKGQEDHDMLLAQIPMRAPTPANQQKFIIEQIKYWSEQLKLAEYKIILDFVREANDWETEDGHFVGMGATRVHWLNGPENKALSYRIKLAFREFYEKDEWSEYDSFYHMAEETVIHELLHVKISKFKHTLDVHIPDGTVYATGQLLQEEEWLVDNLARTLYNLRHNDPRKRKS